jgi:acetoin utilization deacetylase AcuC-like enzyme
MDRRILSRSLRRNEPIGLFQRMLRHLEGLRERRGPSPWSSPWGLDAFEGDPFGGLSVFTLGFARMAEAISVSGLLMLADGGRSGGGTFAYALSASVAPGN